MDPLGIICGAIVGYVLMQIWFGDEEDWPWR